ncbi:class I SAM-dependent methyltransferase [Chelatococcus sp. SYSU_G07232]|uniref:Class I SAM-dependent methyltransferase n=1 Tax=Chelatococcus albus TaxID=3047466 RepID=A0ABT7AE21_9HYPH|nr:class I SAM-dependent methyltransferase [Chelatococcus sp. SYSU_G07232]MDJ1157637.1 class I SAM-dependent methyltransferase [Chelatococcus sp. SYSU_G07232]
MSLSAREKSKLDDYDAIYRQGQLPVMQAVERRVCGCVYGATSWATRDEADLIAAALGLEPGIRLLEVGAGSGWPALYLAARSGCDVTLTDLQVSGLEIALKRAMRDGLAARSRATIADAAQLPFADASFDVINQSDVLCCLVQKRKALSECRRVIRAGGRMACSLIHVPPGLDADDRARAVETAPDFVEAEAEYPVLFVATRWAVLDRLDLTEAFTQSCRAKLRAEEELRPEIERVVGAEELGRLHARMRRRIAVLERGHLKRELFVLNAVP